MSAEEIMIDQLLQVRDRLRGLYVKWQFFVCAMSLQEFTIIAQAPEGDRRLASIGMRFTREEINTARDVKALIASRAQVVESAFIDFIEDYSRKKEIAA